MRAYLPPTRPGLVPSWPGFSFCGSIAREENGSAPEQERSPKNLKVQPPSQVSGHCPLSAVKFSIRAIARQSTRKAIHTPRPVIRSGVMKGQPTYANERSNGDFSGLAEGGKRKGRKPPFS